PGVVELAHFGRKTPALLFLDRQEYLQEIGAERLREERRLRREVERLAPGARQRALLDLRIAVAFDGRARIEPLLDTALRRAEHRGDREIQVRVGTADAMLDM